MSVVEREEEIFVLFAQLDFGQSVALAWVNAIFTAFLFGGSVAAAVRW